MLLTASYYTGGRCLEAPGTGKQVRRPSASAEKTADPSPRSTATAVCMTRLWNSLPVELRQQDICLTEFRRLLKTFLFRWDSAHCDFFVLMAPCISTVTYLLTYLLTYICLVSSDGPCRFLKSTVYRYFWLKISVIPIISAIICLPIFAARWCHSVRLSVRL